MAGIVWGIHGGAKLTARIFRAACDARQEEAERQGTRVLAESRSESTARGSQLHSRSVVSHASESMNERNAFYEGM